MSATLSFWPLRATVAVIAGVLIGQVSQIFLALLLDLMWQQEVTGGRWPLNLPNVILTCLTALIVGFSTGWIAKRNGKVLATIAIFLPLLLIIAFGLITNAADSTEYLTRTYDTKPALWAWIGLIPGLFGGHFGALDGRKYFHRTVHYSGPVFLYFGYVGFLVFHFYTTYVAFDVAGFAAALITCALPILAELYWVWRLWDASGTLLTHYLALFLLIVVFLILGPIALFLAGKTKDGSLDARGDASVASL